MIHFHIVTLFPESIEPYLSASILGRAQEKKKIKVSYYNPRDYTEDPSTSLRTGKWARVDRKPYGGGPGMVLSVEPFVKAITDAVGRKKGVEILFFSPSGKQFDIPMTKDLAKKKHIVLIAGHYEGIDARVAQILKATHVSIGPYILTGGELPAAVIVDAVARYIPGVLGKEESREDERIASSEVYTRPDVFKWKGRTYTVPEVLRSGHHAKINEWKKRTQL